MSDVRKALFSEMEAKGFPKIASLWRSLLKGGCTIFVRSEEGHRPLDAYALHWVSRYLPATVPNVEIVPIYDSVTRIPQNNLIVFGRLHAFRSEGLVAEIAGRRIEAHGRIRSIDGERLIQVDSGEMWVRVEEQKWVRDFGVLRLWRQRNPDRMVINFGGLGPIGTLGTALALTDLNRSAMREVEARLPRIRGSQPEWVELLIKAEREPQDDPIVVSPTEVKVSLERDFRGIGEIMWPEILFDRSGSLGNQRFRVRVRDPIEKIEKLLSQSQVEFAVLAAIAQHTEKEPSLYARMGGYITYEEIARSETVKEVLHDTGGMHVPVVRATIARLRRKLQTPEWDRAFPNLLLRSKLRAEGSGKEVVVLRLRAKSRGAGSRG